MKQNKKRVQKHNKDVEQTTKTNSSKSSVEIWDDEVKMANAVCFMLAGRWEIFQMVIDSGVDMNVQDKKGKTVLMVASDTGLTGVVAYLLEKGAIPDLQSDTGHTALHYASMFGFPDIVAMLLKAGANPNIKNQFGGSPLQVAAQNGYAEIVDLLLEYGAEVDLDLEELGLKYKDS